jgi:hypothetical protein
LKRRITFVIFIVATVGLVAADAWLLIANLTAPIVGWHAAQTAFVVNCVLIVGGMLAIGYAGNGHLFGILIDSRNRYTMAKLQAAAWSVLLIAGLIAAALANLLRSSQGDPFDLKIPQEIFLAAGISLTSLAATPLIHSIKSNQRAPTNVKILEPALALHDSAATSVGRIYVASSPKATTWPDLFRGDETGNADELDLGKTQLFYFTVITLAAYGYALLAKLADAPPISFPELGQSFLTILALSHAGYLGQEAVPHTGA